MKVINQLLFIGTFFKWLLFASFCKPSFQHIHYSNLAQIDCTDSSDKKQCTELQTLFKQNQYLNSLLQSLTGSPHRQNEGYIESETEEEAMNELNQNLRAQQIELSLELQEFLGPVNRVDDICYSQPDTFWYCSRLMK